VVTGDSGRLTCGGYEKDRRLRGSHEKGSEGRGGEGRMKKRRPSQIKMDAWIKLKFSTGEQDPEGGHGWGCSLEYKWEAARETLNQLHRRVLHTTWYSGQRKATDSGDRGHRKGLNTKASDGSRYAEFECNDLARKGETN